MSTAADTSHTKELNHKCCGGSSQAPAQARVNAITIDVEDWLQAVVDHRHPLTDAFQENTRRLLGVLDQHQVRGTFFVLGLAAEKAPHLVREIHAAGHEVQSHGYGHQLVHRQTPDAFREDALRSKSLLEDIIGLPIVGYRAPAFSIDHRSMWALDILVECGFEYDSSIFPLKMPRYGMADALRVPHRIRTASGNELLEIPVASYMLCGRRIPVGGGGYFRLLPYSLLRRGIRQLNGAGAPATIYMHPHEFATQAVSPPSYRPTLKTRLHQGLGRRGFPKKVDRLLTEFQFGTIEQLVRSSGPLTVRCLTEIPCH